MGSETSAVFKAKTIVILLLYTGIKSLQLAAIFVRWNAGREKALPIQRDNNLIYNIIVVKTLERNLHRYETCESDESEWEKSFQSFAMLIITYDNMI